jgi:WD40 repeat protein
MNQPLCRACGSPLAVRMFVVGLIGLVLSQVGGRPQARAANIKPEPLTLMPGKPLSIRALVTQPAPFPEVLAWTVESSKHRGLTTGMAFSPDRKLLATGGYDGMIRIWDMATGTTTRVLAGHDSYVFDIAWSKDGKYLASSGSWDRTVRVWNPANGQLLRTHRDLPHYVRFVRWSPDGNRLAACGGTSGWIWTWDVASDVAKPLLEVGQPVLALDYSPDGEHLALSVVQTLVSVVNFSEAKVTKTLGESPVVCYSVRFSPDGKMLAAGEVGQTVIYSWPEGDIVRKIPGLAYSLSWSPDGKHLATDTASGGVVIYEAATGKALKSFIAPGATAIDWQDEGRLMARGAHDVSSWEPLTGKQTLRHELATHGAPLWNAGRPVLTGLGTNTLSLWDVNTGKRVSKLEGHTGPIAAAAWNTSGKSLATASSDKTLALWDAAKGTRTQSFKDQASPLMSVVWSFDGKLLATGAADGSVWAWRSAGSPIGKLEGHTKPVTALAWSKTNLLASGGSDAKVRLWHAEKKESIREIDASVPVLSLAFSPDSQFLAAGTTDEVVRIWHTSSGKQAITGVRSQASPPSVTDVAWSKDGSMLLAGRGAHIVQLWDLHAPKIIHSLLGMQPVEYVGWSATGNLMVAGISDGTTHFWDTQSAEIRGYMWEDAGNLLMLSPDGHVKLDPTAEPKVMYVVQTADEQLTLTPEEFATKYRWKNAPTQVRFAGR